MSQGLKPDRTRIENLEAQLADILYRLGEIETVRAVPKDALTDWENSAQIVTPDLPVKRKRGRPRKIQPQGDIDA